MAICRFVGQEEAIIGPASGKVLLKLLLIRMFTSKKSTVYSLLINVL